MTQPKADKIEIRVNGSPALTTAMAAARYDRDPAAFRKEIIRRGIEPVAYLDFRTPLYAVRVLDAAMGMWPDAGS